MTVDRGTTLFFDASCLIAAVGSPSGGSGFLLLLCARGFLRGVVSQPVMLEEERNIGSKMAASAIDAFHRLVVLTPLVVVGVPSVEARSHYRSLVGEKDEHVVASAVECEAQYLLTLDKKLVARVNEADLTLRALSPGEFIRSVLPTHRDYTRD